RFDMARSMHLLGYLNAGVNVDAQDAGSSEGRWGVGLDCGLGERGTLAIAVSGRHAFESLLPPGTTTFPHPPDFRERALFGIEGGRADIYDFSIGGRINLWRDELIGFANVILPLNRDGVRADMIPTAGIETTF